MATGSQNMTTYLAKGLEKLITANASNTDNLLYINTADTNITADMLGATTSIAFTRASITGAYTTGHMVWLNAADIGTPFQLVVHDSSDLYLYKRWKSSGAWTDWTKIKAGTADTWTTARTITVGGTGKSVDGSANVSWSMNEIMGSSDSSKFYRGDKTWSNTLTSNLVVNGNIEVDAGIIGNRDQWGLDMYARPFAHHATNPSSTNGGNFYYSAGNKDYYNNPRWIFTQYSYAASSTATNGHYEAYRLPATAAGLTANATYEIRTSKSSAYTVDNATSASACTGNSYGLLSNNTSQAAENCYDGSPGLHFWRYNGSSGQSGGDGWIAQWSWNSGSVGGQIYLDDNPSYTMMIRGRNSDENHTFNDWKRIQLCDGTGASGTWGISITGNASTATAVLDAGDTSKKITIRYSGNGASATDWIPFHDSNGNLVPVSSTNLANKVRDKASGSWGISVTGSSASCTGNAATATRINGNLAAATSNVDRNIWVSSTASADGIPNYISGFSMNPSTKVFNVLAGTRISPNAGSLYLGNSGNQGWVYVQDMCSQDGQKWKIHQAGSAEFSGTVQTGAIKTTGDLNLYTSSADSPDITWWYANQEKEQARIWMGSGGTSTFAPYYRCYNSSGTQLYSGHLVLGNGTGASGTWDISISGNANSANYTSHLLGVNTSNSPYGYSEGNIIRAVWNVEGDNRWYFRAGSYQCRVDYANSAGSVAWANVSGRPTVQNNLTSTSTTDVLSAAQGKALNDNKTAKGTGLAYTTLLNQTYAGTSYKTITVSNISSYNALHFACYFPNFWRGSMLIPISDFKSNQVTIFFMINGSTPEYANFKYISDTSIQISTDNGHSLVFRIWGAKTS